MSPIHESMKDAKEEGVMTMYQEKTVPFEALQLTWENWSDMCGFADVGKLEDGKPTGTDKDTEGNPLPDGGPGLLYPTDSGLGFAPPCHWITKIGDELGSMSDEFFQHGYEPA